MSPFPLDKVRQFFRSEKIWVETSMAWSAQQGDYRTLLRQSLCDKVTELADSGELSDTGDRKELLTLERPPQWPSASLSISHCRERGGFVIARHPLCIGFDIEEVERVQLRIVARMSSPEEMSRSPGPAALWAAKESAYKALLGPRQPSVISEILVDQWLPLEPSMWTYRFRPESENTAIGAGLVINLGRLIFGLSAITA